MVLPKNLIEAFEEPNYIYFEWHHGAFNIAKLMSKKLQESLAIY